MGFWSLHVNITSDLDLTYDDSIFTVFPQILIWLPGEKIAILCVLMLFGEILSTFQNKMY